MALGVFLFVVGQIVGWFQVNSQLMWSWWSDKPLAAAVLFGVPTSVIFWYAWKLTATATESVWSARFIGSSVGFIIFPVLTWFLLGESMFTLKTMSCLSLSVLIILIQIYA